MLTNLHDPMIKVSFRGKTPIQANLISDDHLKILNFIEEINKKVENRLQMVQQIFLDDYKDQMKTMSSQLKTLRNALDEELLKQRSNERLFYLEEERDFFRSQVIKLNEDLTHLNRKYQEKSEEVEVQHQEMKNYKAIAWNLQQKIIRIEKEHVEMAKIAQEIVPHKNPFMESTKAGTVFDKTSSKFQPEPNQINNVASYSKLRSSLEVKLKTPTFQKRESLNAESLAEDSPRKMPKYSQIKIKSHSSSNLQKEDYRIKLVSNPKMASSLQISKREEILDECIKEVKKNIFYRTLNFKETNQTNQIHFEEDQRIPFQKFTKTDKRSLIEQVLSNNQILEQFYEFMINSKQIAPSHKQTTKIAMGLKLNDHRYNSKELHEAKKQFHQKILTLKCKMP